MPLTQTRITDANHIDLSELQTLFDTETLRNLLARFVSSLTEAEIRLEQAHIDWPTLHAEVHSLKGLVGYFGAKGIVALCLPFEQIDQPLPRVERERHLQKLREAITALADTITKQI